MAGLSLLIALSAMAASAAHAQSSAGTGTGAPNSSAAGTRGGWPLGNALEHVVGQVGTTLPGQKSSASSSSSGSPTGLLTGNKSRHRASTTSAPASTNAVPASTAAAPVSTTAPVATTTVSPASAGTNPKIGLSLGDTLMTETPSQIVAELAQIRTLGVSWIRLDLDWSNIQPTSASSYSWSGFDAIVAAAGAEGISLLPIIDYTPAWARPTGCVTEFCAPADPSAFATFAGAAAARYSPQGVHDWEIWNEPNNTQFWQPEPDVAAYVTLLQEAAGAIRGADPRAFVVSGGLAPEATANGNIAQLSYLATFCADGGPTYVDAIGYHAYSYPVLPGYLQSWNAWSQIDGTTPSFRSILNGCGAAAKKIWITEYGAPTNGPGAEATPSNYDFPANPDHVSESLQALMATQSVQLARADPSIGALFWHTYQDRSTDPSTVENFFGLLRSDGTPKPAWSALQSAIAG